jgi:hypothetical protein
MVGDLFGLRCLSDKPGTCRQTKRRHEDVYATKRVGHLATGANVLRHIYTICVVKAKSNVPQRDSTLSSTHKKCHCHTWTRQVIAAMKRAAILPGIEESWATVRRVPHAPSPRAKILPTSKSSSSESTKSSTPKRVLPSTSKGSLSRSPPLGKLISRSSSSESNSPTDTVLTVLADGQPGGARWIFSREHLDR